MKSRMLVFLIVSVLVFLCAPSAAKLIDKDFHETFDVQEGVRLDLRHGDGDVIVAPWDKDVIGVEVRYRARMTEVGFGGEPDFDVEFRQSENVVHVSGREISDSGLVIFRSITEYEYTYTISAPSYVTLELDGDDGDVEISGWRADIDCTIDDGDVDLCDIVNGRTRINYEDGDIRIDGLEGELLLYGDDGDVQLTGCRTPRAKFDLEDGDVIATHCEGDIAIDIDDGDVFLILESGGSVRVRGQDGDVRVELASGAVDVDVAVDDGDVMIALPKDGSFSFLVTMDDGGVKIDLEGVDELERDEHLVSGRVRGGEGQVRVRTADGNVVLKETR